MQNSGADRGSPGGTFSLSLVFRLSLWTRLRGRLAASGWLGTPLACHHANGRRSARHRLPPRPSPTSLPASASRGGAMFSPDQAVDERHWGEANPRAGCCVRYVNVGWRLSRIRETGITFIAHCDFLRFCALFVGNTRRFARLRMISLLGLCGLRGFVRPVPRQHPAVQEADI